jgi:hypothetical protein
MGNSTPDSEALDSIANEAETWCAEQALSKGWPPKYVSGGTVFHGPPQMPQPMAIVAYAALLIRSAAASLRVEGSG